MLSEKDAQKAREAVLFAGLPNDLAETIMAQSTLRSFQRNTTIFLQDDLAESMYVVLDGWVKLFRITPAGSEAVVGVFTRGQSFAEAAAFHGATYPVTAEAVTDTRLLVIRANALTVMMQERPEIALAILSSTFKHLHELVSQIEQLKAHSGAQRVAEFLLELCDRDTGSCTSILPYDKTLIAGRLGMQPQSLSRAFSRLESCGVKISHNQASIYNVEKLREYVKEDRGAPWRKAE